MWAAESRVRGLANRMNLDSQLQRKSAEWIYFGTGRGAGDDVLDQRIDKSNDLIPYITDYRFCYFLTLTLNYN